MYLARQLACTVLLAGSASVLASPCEQVVADTVAEMQAGATGGWNADAENLARAAAGSACVKAYSGRYGTGDSAMSAGGAAPASHSEDVAANTQSAAAEAGAGTDDTATEKEDEEGAFSLGGLTFRNLSGSPSRKPYERSRAARDEE